MRPVTFILSFLILVMSTNAFAVSVHNHEAKKVENCCKKDVLLDCHAEKNSNTSNTPNCCDSDCLCIINYAPVSVLNSSSTTLFFIDNSENEFLPINGDIISVPQTIFHPPKYI